MTTGTSHRSDIQGLRGLAVLLVVAYHADDLVPGGFIGVDVFFVISGYLIGGLLLRELSSTGQVRLREFLTRRARRLLPAYALATGATVVAAALILDFREALGVAARTTIAGSLFVSNLFLYREDDYFAAEAEQNPLLHTWSLSVEEQLYLLLPLLIVLLVRRAVKRRLPIVRATVAIVMAASFGSLVLAETLVRARGPVLGFESPALLAFYAPVTRVWEFGAGVVLAAVVLRHGGVRRSMTSSGLAAGGLLAIGVAALSFDATTPFPGLSALLPVGGSVAILLAGAGTPAERRAPSVTRLLEVRPLTWLGDISYGWYLWHWPTIVLARALWPDDATAVLLAALLSLVPGWVSLVRIEEPLRRDRTIVGWRAARLAAASVLAPVALASAVLVAQGVAERRLDAAGSIDRQVREARAALEAAPERTGDFTQPLDLVLVGDSHAGSLHLELAPLAAARGLDYGVVQQGACTLLAGPATQRFCSRWQRETLELLLEADVETVVLHSYVTGDLTGFRRGAAVDIEMVTAEGDPVPDVATARELYASGLDAVVAALVADGVRVVLLSPTPDFTDGPVPERRTLPEVLSGEATDDANLVAERTVVPVAEAAARIAMVLDIQREVATGYGGVRVVEALPLVCDTTCAQIEDDGTLLFWDRDHLAPAGAARLAQGLLDALGPWDLDIADGG